LRLIFIYSYRFFCEDHKIPLNTSGHSEWHISKERMKRTVSLNAKTDIPES